MLGVSKILLTTAVLSISLGSSALSATANFAPKNSSNNTDQSTPEILSQPAKTIPHGERLIYDIYWMGFRVGLGELWVKEKTRLRGREAYHVVATARANDFLSRIYPVQDEAHSWIDARSFESLQFEKKVYEKNYRVDEKNIFNAKKGTGVVELRQTGEKKEFRISDPTHDILSAFYWVRRQEMIPGRSLKTILSANQKNWQLEVDVLRNEIKELKNRKAVNAIVVEPKRSLDGVGDKRGKARVYLTNDESRTPVYVKIETPFGPVVGVLRHQT